jgi:hypothetical protein
MTDDGGNEQPRIQDHRLDSLATKADLREDGERTRHHMDQTINRIREELRPLTEAVRTTILLGR